ncbi:MAG: hypothetical protein H6607_12115 [Flavobacteriales bacterium]|nr:hypothetical protein [Flavobacteriales bacterium]
MHKRIASHLLLFLLSCVAFVGCQKTESQIAKLEKSKEEVSPYSFLEIYAEIEKIENDLFFIELRVFNSGHSDQHFNPHSCNVESSFMLDNKEHFEMYFENREICYCSSLLTEAIKPLETKIYHLTVRRLAATDSDAESGFRLGISHKGKEIWSNKILVDSNLDKVEITD